MTDMTDSAPSCETIEDRALPARRISSEEIYAQLRDRICLLHYPPGYVLREVELAAEFGVSRTPVREVLQRLAIGGLVEVRNGVGTIVTRLDLDEIEDLYEMRLQVALLIGQLNPRLPSLGDLSLLEDLRDRSRTLQEDFRLEEYWMINHELHRLIAGLIGNRSLRELWDNLYFRAARVWYDIARSFSSEAVDYLQEELDETLTAAREGDMVALGYVQRNHIAYGLKRVRQWHQSSTDAGEKAPAER